MNPKKIDKATLVSLLRMAADAVEKDDSFEGNINYTCMTDQCQRGEFLVNANYRIDNSEGQGGMVLVEGA